MISHECRIPYPEEAEQDGDVPPQGRVEEVLVEVAAARITERGATRADDNFSDSAMEDRKREGYF